MAWKCHKEGGLRHVEKWLFMYVRVIFIGEEMLWNWEDRGLLFEVEEGGEIAKLLDANM